MGTVNLIEVSKHYSHQLILDKVNLTIQKGEFIAVVGPSGCGKSTLLRLVAGLEAVSSGQILINEKCVNQIPPAQRDMAMVFQSYALYPHLSVFENMAYGLRMRGVQKETIHRKVHEVAALLKLSDYLHRKPASLSGGQRQRVAMGRAIIRSPAVFLFDEPLSNLDAKLREEMRYEIRKLHQELNTTCLYVTHDQTEAMTMASKIIILNEGRIEQVGDPQVLYSKPASVFVAGFIGHYPINLLFAIIDIDSKKIVTQCGLEFPLPSDSKPLFSGMEVIIGIRPEHFYIENRIQPNANGIRAKIEFIDNMGADKLVHAVSFCGKEKFIIRVSADFPLREEQFSLAPMLNKANLFDKETGLRLGGWDEV